MFAVFLIEGEEVNQKTVWLPLEQASAYLTDYRNRYRYPDDTFRIFEQHNF